MEFNFFKEKLNNFNKENILHLQLFQKWLNIVYWQLKY